jgi:hypothetical protein
VKSRDKVVIGSINAGWINSNLVVDLLHIMKARPERFAAYVQVENSTLVTRSRNKLVKSFLEDFDAAWLLMIDADQRLPLDAFDKLLSAAHDKDRPIVSGLVFAKFGDDVAIRPVPTIYRWTGAGFSAIDDYPLDTVLPIDGAGTGCLLIHRSVLELLRENATESQGPDWAWFVDGPIAGQWLGEDLLFSRRLASLGIPMHAHTGAICAHRKTFWLDERMHEPIRTAALAQSTN